MDENQMGFYPIHDPELPEVVQALKQHVERLGETYANDCGLDPTEGARRIRQATDIYNRLRESVTELQELGRLPND